MALKRSDVPRPLRRMEAVHVDSLGGELIVKALLLNDRIKLEEMPAEARMPFALSVSVFDHDGEPWHTAEEWQIWGTSHLADLIKLGNAVARLSGLDVEATKKN